MTYASAPPTTLKTVALAGNPNSGKTTLFNALTGLRQKVANYPGVTVEKKTGKCKLPPHPQKTGDNSPETITVIDLPGTYSLVSRSPDEAIATEVLRGLRPDTPAPDVVIVVVDASNLSRNLYLVSQLIELEKPLVVALTMMDIAQRRGLPISPERLEQLLGVPVIPIVGHKKKGVDELKRRLHEARPAPLPTLEWPPEMRAELESVGRELAQHLEKNPAKHPEKPVILGTPKQEPQKLAHYQMLAERLLIGDRSPDLTDIADKPSVRDLVTFANTRLAAKGINPMQADIEAHYRWIDHIAHAATTLETAGGTAGGPHPTSDIRHPTSAALSYASTPTFTQKLDRILIHKVWGLLVFAAVMAGLFYSIFILADPLMGATEDAIAWLGEKVTALIPEGPLHDLVKDGLFAGVGGVVVFVPQIAILFAFLAILEDSGYLARAAFLMDRLLSKVGLSGKAFIPMLSSFACAIPGIMATRTIESRKQRMAAIFVAPFMSCSARLPVYALLISAFFASYGAAGKAAIMFALYSLGVIAAAATAWVMTKFTGREQATFVLELPTYRIPQISQVFRQIWTNTTKFITRAGTVILTLSILLWAAMYYPRLPEERAQAIQQSLSQAPASTNTPNPPGLAASAASTPSPPQSPEDLQSLTEKAIAGEQLRHSLAGRFGHAIEPVIRPLGYDWKIGVGLVGAFAAREVFVSTMGTVYSVGGDDEDVQPLEEAMSADRRPDGTPVWTPAVAASLLVFFVIAMQCISTLAIVARETRSWRWPLGMLAYMNALAYTLALITYQVLSRL